MHRRFFMTLAGAATAVTLASTLTGCVLPASEQQGVEPGTGPQDSDTSQAPDGPESPSESPSEDTVATFKDKITYDDGIEVEVTKVVVGKIKGSYDDEINGKDFATFYFRLLNGTQASLKDLFVSMVVTYGADGTEAKTIYNSDVEGSTDSGDFGTIRVGKFKTTSGTFEVPAKYRGDVQLEVSFSDFEHDSAVFAGKIG